MCGLSAEDLMELIPVVGLNPFPSDGVEEQQRKLKERDAIIEKNKKQKQKAEVPWVDNIIEQEGQWFMQKNNELKTLNVGLNNMGDQFKAFSEKLLNKANGLKLLVSSKGLGKDQVKEMETKYTTRIEFL